MTNAVRHGHASLMELHFFEDEADYMIVLQDNGVGFEPWLMDMGQADDGCISILGGQLHLKVAMDFPHESVYRNKVR